MTRAGLLDYPWVLPPEGARKFDCSLCREACSDAERREMHCGYLPRREWVGSPDFGLPHDTQGYCPGWLVSQPAVLDGYRAWKARDDKCLELYFPGLEAPVLEAADLATQAVTAYRNAEILKLKER